MLISFTALFARQSWKMSGILACVGLGGVLVSMYTDNIFSYFAGHAAAGFVAAFCISAVINIVKMVKHDK